LLVEALGSGMFFGHFAKILFGGIPWRTPEDFEQRFYEIKGLGFIDAIRTEPVDALI
jgi:hypothetical protein